MNQSLTSSPRAWGILGLAWCIFMGGADLVCVVAHSTGKEAGKGYSEVALDVQDRETQNTFHRIPPDRTGIQFVNRVDEWEASQNRVLYNGAGVAAGDYDRDGWPDIFLCAIGGDPVLYRNNGNWTFGDATSTSGLNKLGHLHRGAVFADLNGDDWLDLLVGTVDRGIRSFINLNGKFEEMSPASGLVGAYAPMTMALADVDSNGTLDLYVTNNRPSDVRDEGSVTIKRIGGKLVIPAKYKNRLVVSGGGVKEYGQADFLFLNDGKAAFSKASWTDGSFLDAGGVPLKKPPLDWGLSAAFHDVNADRLPDLYVCNDFWTPDRFWINQGNGVFKLLGPRYLNKTSASSMGVDFSDYDQDGDVDLFVVDMLSRDLELRKRQALAQDSSDQQMGRGKSAPQVMRNTLLNNRGDGSFSELANLAQLSASDWSWSPVFLDVDLDGYEDVVITAGHYKDTQDMDVNALIQTRQKPRDRSLTSEQRKTQFSREMMTHNRLYPDLDLPVIIFRNLGNGVFEEKTKQWGTHHKAVHHGMALADFDLDGDMDFVVNNMNQESGLYENRFIAPRVAIVLHGEPPNTQGIGGKVTLVGGAIIKQTKEIVSGGRFLSGSEAKVVFACGNTQDSMRLMVSWRSGQTSEIDSIKPNHLYHVHESGASQNQKNDASTQAATLFVDSSESIGHFHTENLFDDYARQPLLPFKLSHAGPAACVCDINGDQWDDLILGSSAGGRLHVFLNDHDGGFKKALKSEIIEDEIASVFTLGTGRGNEFYTINGGYEGSKYAGLTRHHLKNGKVLSGKEIKTPLKSVSAIAQADIDADGDLDLFLGGGPFPGKYPESARSMIYIFDGTQYVPDSSNIRALLGLGIVFGAVWCDFDADGYPELVTAGHWQPVRVFKNEKGVLRDVSRERGLAGSTGLWNSIQVGDINADGRMDLVAGNWGLNSSFKATPAKPLNLVFGDFDQDGNHEIIESDHYGEELVPVRQFGDLAMSMPYLYSRFQSFRQFSRANVAQVLGENQKLARQVFAQTLHSCVYINEGGHFRAVKLPQAAQWGPTHGIVISDFNGDGFEDLFLAQNFFPLRSQLDSIDASRGVFLKGPGTDRLTVLNPTQTGLQLHGDQRAAVAGDFNRDGRTDLIVTQNSGETKVFLNQSRAIGIRVRVTGPLGNPDGIGSILRLKYFDGLGPARQIIGSSGYRSQGSSVHVLHSNRQVESLRVQKPDGRILSREIEKITEEIKISY